MNCVALNTYPRISIVTPSFQQGEYLEDTIVSVVGQNYPSLEYIIVDGGSTDRSVDIIKNYSARLSWWVSERDNGQYDAINKGFERSTGEIMGWLNSDDLYLPWTLRTVGQIFAEFPQIQWISGGVCGMNSNGQIFHCNLLRGGISRDLVRRGCYQTGMADYLSQEGMFWRRSLWNSVGARLNTSYHLAADFELWCRFSAIAEPVAVRCLLAAIRSHPNSQRSIRFARQYATDVDDITGQISKHPRVWRLVRRYPVLSALYQLLWARGSSSTLRFDAAHDNWQLYQHKKGPLYIPLVVRRSC